MKTYIITEDERAEILNLLRSRSYIGVRTYLSQLKELESETKLEKKKTIKMKKNKIDVEEGTLSTLNKVRRDEFPEEEVDLMMKLDSDPKNKFKEEK